MKLVALEEGALTLAELADLAKEQPVVLTRRGKPVAVVSDLSGSDLEAVALANNPQFLALIEASRRSYREQGGTSLEDLRKELSLKAPQQPTSRKKRA
jgi:PHD/YefM family antitoxin component YafN of YafNO toxin-antitoxin module